MIAAEIGLLLYLIISMSAYSVVFLVEVMIVNAMVLIVIINADYNPEYRVSWVAAVLLLPIFGALLYVLFHGHGMRRREEMLAKDAMLALNKLDECGVDAEGISEIDEVAGGKARAILSIDPTAAMYRGVSKYYPSGEALYEDMLRALRGAKRYIFLEYFIIERGEMWDGILEILREKVKGGVEVRVMFDDIGCMKKLPHNYERTLSSFGIQALRFSPASPRVSSVHNNRDHRKICIVDGEIAFTGGVNLADEYINRAERFGHWKDGGVSVRGDAVTGFVKMFLTMWEMSSRHDGDFGNYLPKSKEELSDSGYYIPFGSGPSPLYPAKVGKRAIIDIINQATKYVYITTPYLIIDFDLTSALIGAEERGVDVRIITPGIADKKMVKVMTKSAYPKLIGAGVRIFEYTPGFIHEKLLVSDDKYCIIGTINFDYRSLVHHFEDALWIYGSPTVTDARDSFLETESVSHEVTAEEARLNFFEVCVKCVLGIFAPLL